MYYEGINSLVEINYEESIMRIEKIDLANDFIKENNK